MRNLITGASRGIGAEMARQMAARGDEVIGTFRSAHPDLPIGWHEADVTRPADVQAIALGLETLDLLVCNAGVYLDKGQALDTGYPPDMWQTSFAINVTGVFLTVQALLPALRKAKGKIAIISSQMASDEQAPGGSYIYRASKAASLNLGRNLAADLRVEGIAVGIYHPGWVQTDMGGSAAEITPEAAARGLIAEFDVLSLATTGCFRTWDGRDHAF